jgi:hypothetical protein
VKANEEPSPDGKYVTKNVFVRNGIRRIEGVKLPYFRGRRDNHDVPHNCNLTWGSAEVDSEQN